MLADLEEAMQLASLLELSEVGPKVVNLTGSIAIVLDRMPSADLVHPGSTIKMQFAGKPVVGHSEDLLDCYEALQKQSNVYFDTDASSRSEFWRRSQESPSILITSHDQGVTSELLAACSTIVVFVSMDVSRENSSDTWRTLETVSSLQLGNFPPKVEIVHPGASKTL